MPEAFQRLSAQDASFLAFEGPTTPMNVGGTSIFEGGPLLSATGAVDVSRIKQLIASKLHQLPRYRERLAYVPVERQPVWVDDQHFDLAYHVRHIALPQPGDEAQLKWLTADILSRPLDRQRPLWELWVVEGLEDNRFATVIKAHHCMIDGISGVDMLGMIMRPTPDATIWPPHPWRPRRPPSDVELLRHEVLRRAQLPLAGRRAPRKPRPHALRSDFADLLGAVWSTVHAGLRGAANTPINQPIGAYRRFEWVTLDLAEVKQIKQRLGGTVNDVVLATVAGAVRRFLQRRGTPLRELSFRVAAPVNMRAPGDLTPGNRVSVWLTGLPIQERDPRRRLARVCETTTELKKTKQALGTSLFLQVADWAGPAMVAFGTRVANRMSPYNLLVTNIPGPQFPLYLLGSRMLAAYPEVPLFENQGLEIALFSYDGRLCWGFNADWDLLPDVSAFADDVKAAFAELRRKASRLSAQGTSGEGMKASGGAPARPLTPKRVAARSHRTPHGPTKKRRRRPGRTRTRG